MWNVWPPFPLAFPAPIRYNSPMKILLATLHAKYVHASLALPCLAAVCAGLDGVETVIREFTVNEPPERVLRTVAACEADAIAFSCYIWNVEATLRLASDLKKIRPETLIILGGPEVSFGTFELMERHTAVDFVVRGEGEATFPELVRALRDAGVTIQPAPLLENVAGITFRADGDIVATSERPPIADLGTIPSPFASGLVDLAKPLVYLETSRGCPFSCAFCMSSLEKGVRSFPPQRIRNDLTLLMDAGVATVKLVDRTFNYDAGRADAVWEFIIAANSRSRFHFEIAADLLTDANLTLLHRVPAGAFRFEIGVQAGTDATLARVGRKSDLGRLFANVRRLVAETGVVVHLDLVAGLPAEDYPGFLASLQLLFDSLRPDDSRRGAESRPPAGAGDTAGTDGGTGTNHFIQVELLKVLKGSPMRRIAAAQGYAFSDAPPYQILHTPWLSFADVCRIVSIARLLDLFFNSGRFTAALAFVARTAPLARFFDHCARCCAELPGEPEAGRHGVYELFRRCGETFVGDEEREDLGDVLAFDFCCREYPAAGSLPSFLAVGSGGGKWGKGKEADPGVEAAPGSRVRTYTRTFGRDYTVTPWGKGHVVLTFVYVSAPGEGLRIFVRRTG